MQQRQLVWLIVALLVLLAIAYFSGTFSNEISTIEVPELSFSDEAIETFSITTGDTTDLVFIKEEGAWVLSSPVSARADSLAVSRLIQNLAGLELETVVSTNPDRYEEYGVGPSAQQITVTMDEESATLTVGRPGPDFQSAYVRLNEDPRVFLTNGQLYLNREVDTWRDKTVIDLRPQTIEQLAFSSASFEYELAVNNGAWTLIDEGSTTQADSALVARYLNRFTPLTALGFFEQVDPGTVEESATHQIAFTDSSGSVLTLWLLDQENELLATTGQAQNTFRLQKSMLPTYVPESSSFTDN